MSQSCTYFEEPICIENNDNSLFYFQNLAVVDMRKADEIKTKISGNHLK